MAIKPFEIWIARSGEVIGELKSGETAHRIAHMFLEEWPEWSPLAVKDWIRRTTRFVEVDTCGFADCEFFGAPRPPQRPTSPGRVR